MSLSELFELLQLAGDFHLLLPRFPSPVLLHACYLAFLLLQEQGTCQQQCKLLLQLFVHTT